METLAGRIQQNELGFGTVNGRPDAIVDILTGAPTFYDIPSQSVAVAALCVTER